MKIIPIKSSKQEVPKAFIKHDFQKIWKYFPVKRSLKEKAKNVLFWLFPLFFRRWEIYQNWQNAQIFRNKDSYFRKIIFWKRKFSNTNKNNIPVASVKTETQKSSSTLAIVIHAFYPEIFSEILEMLELSKFRNLSLYVTTPLKSSAAIEQLLKKSSFKFKIFISENHGRDILPFINVLPKIFEDGHQLVLKLHTKGSNHLNKKELWKNDLFEKLIGKDNLVKNVQLFNQNNLLGILGPVGHIVPMYLYYGANALNVKMLSDKLGIESSQLQNLNFVAGSMFFATKKTLLPILGLGLTADQFEPEFNQLDGTMAHAVERAFGLGLLISGLILADTTSTTKNISCKITKDHSFTI